jgi:four helix bundle protein
MAIALKEANKTQYWLELLYQADYIDEKGFSSINQDCIELLKLLTAIIKSTKSN